VLTARDCLDEAERREKAAEHMQCKKCKSAALEVAQFWRESAGQ
jgi:hypothetical protein